MVAWRLSSARDPELDRFVAVKVLPSFEADDPTFEERFRREARAAAGLHHPNIVPVHDLGQDKGFSYIVMELVTGGTLHDRMGARLGLTEAMALIVPVAAALDYAHKQGVVHRDIKPSNVLLGDDGRPMLSDFGLARMLEGGTALTRADTVLGTPEYMAPEQAIGRPADHRADLYALGIIVYQMLLGQTPFKSDSPSTTLMGHIHSPVPLPSAEDPDFDPRLEATLIKALAKEPEDRYQSSGDMVRALERGAPETVGTRAAPSDTASDVTVAEAPPTFVAPAEATPDTGRRRWSPLLTISVSVVVLAAFSIAGLLAAELFGSGPSVDEPTVPDPTGPTTANGSPPVVPVDPGSGHIVYAADGRVYRIEAREGARPQDVSAALEVLSPEGDDQYIGISRDGSWMVVETGRFDPECLDWPCLALVPSDLSGGEVVRVKPGYWEAVHSARRDGRNLIGRGPAGIRIRG